MSHFRITHIWPERYRGSCIFKVRFEKLALQERSWWFPEEPPRPDFSIRPLNNTCSWCGVESAHIHQEEWLCLNNTCEAFWKKSDGVYASDVPNYNFDFLNSRTYGEVFIPCSLLPVHGISWTPQIPLSVFQKMRLTSQDLADFQTITKGHGVPDEEETIGSRCIDGWNWKGFICPLCRRCNSRFIWNALKCENCSFSLTLPMDSISLTSLTQGGKVKAPPSSKRMRPSFEHTDSSGYRYRQWSLDGIGSIWHVKSTEAINEQPDGPNDLFNSFQTTDIGLKRLVLRQANGKPRVS